MTINHPFGDAAARGQTARTAGSNVDETDGGTRSGRNRPVALMESMESVVGSTDLYNLFEDNRHHSANSKMKEARNCPAVRPRCPMSGSS